MHNPATHAAHQPPVFDDSPMIGRLTAWWRGRQASQIDIPAETWAEVESGLWFLDHLGTQERADLRQLAREFIAAKEWTGAQGLQLTPRIQLAIALQACLPILHLGLDWYSGWVGIIVYPGDFIIPRQVMDEGGVVHEFDDQVMGEAWHGGPVLVSWFDDPAGQSRRERGDPRVRPQARHEVRRRRRHAAAARRHVAQALGNRGECGTAFEDFRYRVDSAAKTPLIDPLCRGATHGVLRRHQRSVLRGSAACYGTTIRKCMNSFRLFYRQDPADIARSRVRV
jgi:hypothetical protein